MAKLDFKALIEKIFAINSDIRYVAVADSKFQLIESRMRETVPTMSSEKVDADFFSWVPSVMIEGVSKISQYAGSVKAVVIRYEKLLAIYIPAEKNVVALTVNRSAAASAFNIADSVGTLIGQEVT